MTTLDLIHITHSPMPMPSAIVKRGQLIQFSCTWEPGRVGCSWEAIYHGDGFMHSVKRDSKGRLKRGSKHDTWRFGGLLPEDTVRRLPHGVRVVRDLTAFPTTGSDFPS